MSGNAHDQRGEQQGRNDRLDQAQEDQAEHAQVHRDVREVVPDFGAHHHADQNPGGEGALGNGIDDQRENGGPAHHGGGVGRRVEDAIALAEKKCGSKEEQRECGNQGAGLHR